MANVNMYTGGSSTFDESSPSLGGLRASAPTAKTFTDIFGPSAKLYRSKDASSPFYVDTKSAQRVYDSSTGSWQDEVTDAGGRWQFNPQTNSFDYMAAQASPLSGGTLQFAPTASKSISAADLGLTNAPIDIAGLASQAGQNADTWSDWAYKHADPQYAPGSQGYYDSVRKALGDDWSKITGYEAKKSGWDTFMDNAWAVPLIVAAAAAGAPVDPSLLTEGGSTIGGDVALDSTLGDTLFNSSMQDLIAGNEALLGSDVAGGITGGLADTIGNKGWAANKAATDAYTSSLLSPETLSSMAPTLPDVASGKSWTDIAKMALDPKNVSAFGGLLSAATGKDSQTVSGSAGRPAWMNQGLPTVPQQTYTSNKIQGDPYRYGMGPQQKLYTNQSGEVYTPPQYGLVGGLQYGVPAPVVKKAHGGSVDYCEGGGLSMAAGYVGGGSPGQDDDVDAKLSHGEYVFDADVVSALGDGNNEAGAAILDKFRENIRKHKRSAPANQIPPKSKGVDSYLKGVK